MKKISFAAAMLAVAFGIYACSSHTDDHSHAVPTDEAGGHTSPYPTCQKIIDACHEYDVGEGPVHDCHEIGHDAVDDTSCAAKLTECQSTCAAAAADAGEGDGGHEASDDAGHDH